MELILGRENDEQMSRFVVIKQGRIVETIGNPGSVPKTVSRADATNPASKLGHLKLVIDENNNTVTVVKSKNNPVYVNGHEIEKKVIDPFNDRVQLGRDRWVMPLREIADKYVPKVFDMRGLRVVWDDYDSSTKDARKKMARLNAYRSGVPILSTIAIAMSFIPGATDGLSNGLRITLYAIVILANIIFFIISFRNSSKTIEDEEARKRLFQQYYVCPSCKRFLGNTPYELLRNQYKKCPGCQVKFNW